jgi:ABC-2 type transport system permease protein
VRWPASGVLGRLYLPPLFALLVPDPWRTRIEQVAPLTAGLSVEATRHLSSLADRPWTGMAILAAWAAGSLLLGGTVLRARDA